MFLCSTISISLQRFCQKLDLASGFLSSQCERAHNFSDTQIVTTLGKYFALNLSTKFNNQIMTGNTFFSRLGDLADRSKFASDPINLTHSQDREHTSAKENSMRSYMEQNSIALCDNRKEVSSFVAMSG